MNSEKKCVVLFCINSVEVSEFTAWNVSAFGVTLVLCGSISVIVSVLFDITLTRHVQYYFALTLWKFQNSLREMCPYSELFWSLFSCIWTEYWEILRISPYLVRIWEYVDQNNSEYGHFLRSDCFSKFL